MILLPTALYHKMKNALDAAHSYLENPELYNRHETLLSVADAIRDIERAVNVAKSRRIKP